MYNFENTRDHSIVTKHCAHWAYLENVQKKLRPFTEHVENVLTDHVRSKNIPTTVAHSWRTWTHPSCRMGTFPHQKTHSPIGRNGELTNQRIIQWTTVKDRHVCLNLSIISESYLRVFFSLGRTWRPWDRKKKRNAGSQTRVRARVGKKWLPDRRERRSASGGARSNEQKEIKISTPTWPNLPERGSTRSIEIPWFPTVTQTL